jgi:hypothetical protein
MKTLTDEAREARARRAAKRQGLMAKKSHRRDPRANDHGTFALIDPDTNVLVVGDQNHGFGLKLDQLEEVLGIG